MSKAIVFLGICILVSALIIGGVWYFNTATISTDKAKYDRYFFGTNQAGVITSVADKETGWVIVLTEKNKTASDGWNYK